MRIAVIGAGPAGSSAAYQTAKNGLRTIFIDKKTEIGENVPPAPDITELIKEMADEKEVKNKKQEETELKPIVTSQE